MQRRNGRTWSQLESSVVARDVGPGDGHAGGCPKFAYTCRVVCGRNKTIFPCAQHKPGALPGVLLQHDFPPHMSSDARQSLLSRGAGLAHKLQHQNICAGETRSQHTRLAEGARPPHQRAHVRSDEGVDKHSDRAVQLEEDVAVHASSGKERACVWPALALLGRLGRAHSTDAVSTCSLSNKRYEFNFMRELSGVRAEPNWHPEHVQHVFYA